MALQKIYVDYDFNKNSILNAKLQPVTTAERNALASGYNSNPSISQVSCIPSLLGEKALGIVSLFTTKILTESVLVQKLFLSVASIKY